MSNLLVSVVVVTFESQREIGDCIRSVFASSIPIELIIVDNGSSDRTVERVSRVMEERDDCRLICNAENLGFAVAVNQGIYASRGQYVLVLNPDCVLHAKALRRAVSALEADPHAALAGCLLLNPDGSEQAGARRSFPTPWRSLVRVLKLDRLSRLHPKFNGFLLNFEPIPTAPTEVEATSGAFMLVRRKALEQIGVLDEGYFMHCEDLDWCMRFGEAGWKVLFVPSAKVVHKKGASSRTRPIRVELYKHRGMLRFYRKYFRHRYPAVLMWCVTVAVWLRFAVKATVMTGQKLWNAFKLPSPRGEIEDEEKEFAG